MGWGKLAEDHFARKTVFHFCQTPDGDAVQLAATLMSKSVLNCDWPLVLSPPVSP